MDSPTRPPPRSRRKLYWLGAVIVVALLIGGRALHWIHVEHRLSTVTEGQVYRSAAMHPGDYGPVARRLGLRSVIDLRTGVAGQDSTGVSPRRDLEAERKAVESLGVKYISLPTGQVPDDATVDRFLAVIGDPANRPALIHCTHGTGRTELFVALWRIEFEGWSNDDARRAASAFFVAGTSFDTEAEKGRYLMAYRPHRKPAEAH